MSIRGDLTQRLTTRLRLAGNNVSDIARLCGVSRQTAHAWLRGQGANSKHLVRLADLTGAHLPQEFKREFDLLVK